MTAYKIDPKLDLVLERVVDVPPELVWRAWTEPKHLMPWFTPAPWKTVDCEIDLRPGGIFRTVMRSPEGQDMDNSGCYLEVVENRRLIFTDALLPGFRPRDGGFFTGIVSITPEGKGTRYTATAIHKDEAGRKSHEEMGFHSGWGTALDQLVAYAKTNM
ncbi:MAG: SRPBCC family protein [Afipia sp.]